MRGQPRHAPLRTGCLPRRAPHSCRWQRGEERVPPTLAESVCARVLCIAHWLVFIDLRTVHCARITVCRNQQTNGRCQRPRRRRGRLEAGASGAAAAVAAAAAAQAIASQGAPSRQHGTRADLAPWGSCVLTGMRGAAAPGRRSARPLDPVLAAPQGSQRAAAAAHRRALPPGPAPGPRPRAPHRPGARSRRSTSSCASACAAHSSCSASSSTSRWICSPMPASSAAATSISISTSISIMSITRA
jgi:hypothetical protein